MSRAQDGGSVKITYIGTATTLVQVDNIIILTDPYFSEQGTQWPGKSGVTLVNSYTPAMNLCDLPPIDLILLSHEDHKDNLDNIGRQLLDGRRVVTTRDGARNLQPREGVRGLRPGETTDVEIGNGTVYSVTATPCQHLPPGECISFVLTSDRLGSTDGKPNAIYISGDTAYMDELATLGDRYNISIALIHLGRAMIPGPDGETMQITMDVEQGLKLGQQIGAKTIVPIHFEGWNHFTEDRSTLVDAIEKSGSKNRFVVLEPGVGTSIGLGLS